VRGPQAYRDRRSRGVRSSYRAAARRVGSRSVASCCAEGGRGEGRCESNAGPSVYACRGAVPCGDRCRIAAGPWGRSIHYTSACTYGVVLLEMMCSDPCTDWFARLGDLFYQLFHFAMCRTLSRLDAARWSRVALRPSPRERPLALRCDLCRRACAAQPGLRDLDLRS
jgi:hypothetical protein